MKDEIKNSPRKKLTFWYSILAERPKILLKDCGLRKILPSKHVKKLKAK